jgi:adenine-specific DNA-methyltransferase
MAKNTLKTKAPKQQKTVETLTHDEASRKNIPTAEYQSVMRTDEQTPIRVAYERRNRDLDPQLVWRGKDEQDWSDLVVPAPPLYIQEKVQPKVLIDDLRRQTEKSAPKKAAPQFDLFADFNGLPSEDAKTEFYQHDAHWSNRMILGDSLQVMASLAEREGLRGQVQCIYIDPPYGIKFNSNFQWSTTDRADKKDKPGFITREPEQVKAFRDTWRDEIHSYLTYLRDRLTVCRDLLSDSGSIFIQIGDSNVHLIRCLLDEVFRPSSFCALLPFQKTMSGSESSISSDLDYLIWYAKKAESMKYRPVKKAKDFASLKSYKYAADGPLGEIKTLNSDEKGDPTNLASGQSVLQISFIGSQDPGPENERYYTYQGRQFDVGAHRHWKTSNPVGLDRLAKASRIVPLGSQLNYKRFAIDSSHVDIGVLWNDVGSAGFSNSDPKVYVVQTDTNVIARCIRMTTDPGDLVLDPTCGSGTTAYVAEQWGRRWITIDTSRVALALARARVMGARYPFYLLADSKDGQMKEGQITGRVPSEAPTHNSVRQGFVYERVPHITLKSIANNAEIDVIWDEYQVVLEPLREQLNVALKKKWQEWEIPREANPEWPQAAKNLHAEWWEQRIARQKAIDASIAAKAEFEYLHDKPYEDNKKVRVSGPFTVESLSPHRVLAVDEDEELVETTGLSDADARNAQDFVQVILDTLKISGVQQAHKDDKITFSSMSPWPGDYICADGRYTDVDGTEKRAAIFIGPEFGTVSRPNLVSAAKEAGDAGFDVLITCAFNYDAHSSDFSKLGRIPVLKARMNADLHMAEDLKSTGKGNLFVIFGEPDIQILPAEGGQIQVKVNGVDVFKPHLGKVESSSPDELACWFIDTDYNEESFFVRHAYFLGANDPYKALKTTLKAEINEEAWETLHSDISRPFDKPTSGRIAVKVINHLGDEVMKVFKAD